MLQFTREANETILVDGHLVELCFSPKEEAISLKKILDMMTPQVITVNQEP